MQRARWVMVGCTLVAWMAAASCTSIKKGLGLRTDLKDKKIKSVAVQTLPKGAACPGDKLQLVVKVAVEGGEPLVTEGVGDGKLLWTSLKVESDGAVKVKQDDDNLVAVLSQDGKALTTTPPVLNVTSPENKDVLLEASPIEVKFNCKLVADYSGPDGREGRAGQQGYNARRDWENGGDGSQGGTGDSGKRGDNVMAQATVVVPTKENRPFLQVCTQGKVERNLRCYFVDTDGGSLVLDARGGAGGKGGTGGSAGSGGRQGRGGNAGRGGAGGDGGEGGTVTLVMDPAVEPYRKLIKIKTGGGKGGKEGSMPGLAFGFGGGDLSGRDGYDGPDPEVRVEPVAPLW